ncbi:MAG: lysophospholipase [Clostridiales bacterium]|nr:lysophospholipase [Clostridiales bacterium]
MEKWEKIEMYKQMNQKAEPGKIVCAGSSLMEMFPIEKLLKETGCGEIIYNRGISGFVTEELLDAIDVCILDLKPSRLFLNIGTNDLNDPQMTPEKLMKNYEKILNIVEHALPRTEIYLMAYYPVNYEAATEEMKQCLRVRTNEKINQANEKVKKLAEKHGGRYIDINQNLKDEEGRLRAEFTTEGMHINEEGYRAVFPEFLRYVKEEVWGALEY